MIDWRTGCSGFYNRHWKGIFYPEKLPQSKWFSFYCEQFNTLELNVTFYRFPTKEMLSKWYDKSPSDFLFSVKAPQLITHYKTFADCGRLLNDFYSACSAGLKEKLGCMLFQLPARVQYSEEHLNRIIGALHSDFRNVIEFRHESWRKKKVYDMLAEKKIIFCNADLPKFPFKPVFNNELFYLRLHGNPRMFYSSYSATFLKVLEEKLSAKRKLKQAFIYFNNTAGEAGILNALQFQKLTA